MEVKITKKLIVIAVALLLVSPWFVMLHSVATNDTLDDTLETTTEPITTVVQTTEPTTQATTKPVTTTAETTKAKSTTTFKVTAYCACTRCTDGDGITASGTKATQGRTIAADPRYYPYGTKIILNGRTYVVEDCGGAIKGNRIDLYFDSHQDALQWGVRYIEGVVV